MSSAEVPVQNGHEIAHDADAIPTYYTGLKETLTNIVDYTALKYPSTLYAEFPISSTTFDAGLRKVTYGNLANAINGVAWWLHHSLGPGGPDKGFPTLAYIGPNDLRYNALILGAVKAGYKVCTTSL
jgi:acyl-CoA synthetase (AMP-forming)/AMP-acid ligase II